MRARQAGVFQDRRAAYALVEAEPQQRNVRRRCCTNLAANEVEPEYLLDNIAANHPAYGITPQRCFQCRQMAPLSGMLSTAAKPAPRSSQLNTITAQSCERVPS